MKSRDALDYLSEAMRRLLTTLDRVRDEYLLHSAKSSYIAGRAPQIHYVNAALRYYEKWER